MIWIAVTLLIAGLLSAQIPIGVQVFAAAVPTPFGCVGVRVPVMPPFGGILRLERGMLIVTDAVKGKRKLRIPIGWRPPDTEGVSVAHGILQRLDVSRADCYVTAGVANDAFASAMLAGSLRTVLGMLTGYAKCRYPSMRGIGYTEANYTEDRLEAGLSIKLSVSLADVLCGVAIGTAHRIMRHGKEKAYASA